MKRTVAIVALTLLYGASSFIGRVLRRRIPLATVNRLLVVGTFHNPNWAISHLRPLAHAGFDKVILVCDSAPTQIPGLTIESAPEWMQRIFSRAGAKLIWTFVCARRYQPELFMGYHIFPAAIIALVVGRINGGAVCYQDTSGPLELNGGGFSADNPLLRMLGKPSPWVERRVASVVRTFDLVVVRGSTAAEFVRKLGYSGQLVKITGSVSTESLRPRLSRDIDILFAGQLIERKRPEFVLRVIAKVVGRIPTLQATIIGNGELREQLESSCNELGITSNVVFLGQRNDVMDIMGRSKTFILASRSEGVSIAMLEAMASGSVPVVSDVGDLRDFAVHGDSGFVLQPEDFDGFVESLITLVSDDKLRIAMSKSAMLASQSRTNLICITDQWRRAVRGIVDLRRKARS